MSDYSDSSRQDALPVDADASADRSLQTGLAALKRQDYAQAIAHLEAAHQLAIEPLTRIKAQIGLVKAYTKTGQRDLAIALCQPLCESSSDSVRTWATQTLAQLSPAQSSVQSSVQSSAQSPSDATGFVPLDDTGFTPLPTPASREIAQPRAVNSPQESRSISAPAQPERSPGGEDSLPTPDTTELLPVDTVDATAPPTLLQPSETTFQPATTWKRAGRVQKWTTLAPVDRSGFWALQVGTAIGLFLLLRWLLPLIQMGVNTIVTQITLHRHILFQDTVDITWFVLVTLAVLFALSPWLLDAILKRVYSLQPIYPTQLESLSPETVRLLKRVCGQRRLPLPKLAILPTAVPLALTYGYLPGNARIAVSQGLLDQLDDDEIAVVYAAELGHILQWDFGIMSWLVLVAQLPYFVYSQVAAWSDRQPYLIVQAIGTLVSALAYGLYWLCRLPGLWLSRVRLYFSDRLATELTGNPNALVRALLKLSIGTAQEIQRWGYTSDLLQSFDLLTSVDYRTALSLGSVYCQSPTTALLEWERQNPDRHWLSWNEAHPPLGDRLTLLTLYARHWRLESELDWAPAANRPFILRRLLLQISPLVGIAVGISIAALLWLIGWVAYQAYWSLDWLWHDQSIVWGCMLIGFSVGLFLWINPAFPDIKPPNVQVNPDLATLLTSPDALPIDSLPVQLQGKLLGRRGFRNRLYQDLILHTPTGSIRLHYTSRWGPLGNLLQIQRPSALLGRSIVVTGWFRRGVSPWIDIETIQGLRGAALRSKKPLWLTILAGLSALLGASIIFQGGS